MLLRDNTIFFAVGMSKSGKSYRLKSELVEWLDDGGRAFILDVVNDFPRDMEWDGAMAQAATFENADKLMRTGWQCVLFQPGKPQFSPIVQASRAQPLIEHVSNLILTESTKEKPIALVISEAHLQIAQKGSLGEQTWHLLTAYRHYGAAVMLDSQRPVAVKMEARSQVEKLCCFAMASDADIDWVKEVGGVPLVEAVKQCAVLMTEGQQGWHVCLDPRAPLPPFTLERL